MHLLLPGIWDAWITMSVQLDETLKLFVQKVSFSKGTKAVLREATGESFQET